MDTITIQRAIGTAKHKPSGINYLKTTPLNKSGQSFNM